MLCWRQSCQFLLSDECVDLLRGETVSRWHPGRRCQSQPLGARCPAALPDPSHMPRLKHTTPPSTPPFTYWMSYITGKTHQVVIVNPEDLQHHHEDGLHTKADNCYQSAGSIKVWTDLPLTSVRFLTKCRQMMPPLVRKCRIIRCKCFMKPASGQSSAISN